MSVVMPLIKHASLVQLESRRIFLLFDRRHIGRDELVPFSLASQRAAMISKIATMTAGDFVKVCMAIRFNDASEWPVLAREFLWPAVV